MFVVPWITNSIYVKVIVAFGGICDMRFATSLISFWPQKNKIPPSNVVLLFSNSGQWNSDGIRSHPLNNPFVHSNTFAIHLYCVVRCQLLHTAVISKVYHTSHRYNFPHGFSYFSSLTSSLPQLERKITQRLITLLLLVQQYTNDRIRITRNFVTTFSTTTARKLTMNTN
jgi:hypothetical protein